jgi:toxin-antitoxin system PIN domain toxin
MVIVDANVLIYAASERLPHHERAKRWIEDALNGPESVGFAWIALLAFLRLSTRRGLFPRPLEPAAALDVVDTWLAARPSVVPHPGSRHASIVRELLLSTGTAGNLVSDAHLAALALEHGARICTFDRDFGRFPGVRTFAPA